jgi:hypothetical protein
MIIPLDSVRLIHKNKTACVIGSGDSLKDHIHKIPAGSIIFSVNTRPLRKKILQPEEVHYLVYSDPIEAERSVEFFGKVTRCSFPSYISKGMNPRQNDIPLDNRIFNDGFSSPIACSLAQFMGCSAIVLFGMDCYRGKPYFDSVPCSMCNGTGLYNGDYPDTCSKCKGKGTAEIHPQQKVPLRNHFKAWLRLQNHMNRMFIDNDDLPVVQIFTVNPPLDMIFRFWDPS